MEKEFEIIDLYGEESFKTSRKNLELSVPEQKLLMYLHRIHPFRYTYRKDTKTHVYWSTSDYKPRFNNKLFYTQHSKKGLSFDKKTKELKVWFGVIPSHDILSSFFSYFNYSLHTELPDPFKYYITKSLLKDIAKGKIKDIDDYALHLSKRSLMFKGISVDIIKYLIYNSFTVTHMPTGLDNLAYIIKNVVNPIDSINLMFQKPWIVNDMYRACVYANCLNQKINLSSETQVKQELDNLSVTIKPLLIECDIKFDPLPF